MPRTKNPELRESLEGVLRRSLVARGLNATSYQLVAEEAGISRALVQYYYPRKMDFAINFLEKATLSAAEILGIDAYAENARLSYLDAYRIGCLYYGFLLDEEGGQLLLFDILKDRELADELMYLHYAWGLVNIDPTRPAHESRSQDVIQTWGGFYELMYFSIKQDFRFDVSERLIPLLESFHAGGSEPFPPAELFRAHQPSAAQMKEMKARLLESRTTGDANALRAAIAE